MQRELAAAWQARAPGLPFAEPYQALILASLVEKEAALKSERAIIAGVFINRLKKGMRLQSDPTVIYGLGENYDGSVHTRDLQTDNPYNTYTREGLPPTPDRAPRARGTARRRAPRGHRGAVFRRHRCRRWRTSFLAHPRGAQPRRARLPRAPARRGTGARRALARPQDAHERGQVHHPGRHRGGRQIHGRARSWSRRLRAAGLPVLATREPGRHARWPSASARSCSSAARRA